MQFPVSVLLFVILGVASAVDVVTDVQPDSFSMDGLEVMGAPCSAEEIISYTAIGNDLITCMKTGLYLEQYYAILCEKDGKSLACTGYYDGMMSPKTPCTSLPGMTAATCKSKMGKTICNDITDVGVFKDTLTTPVSNLLVVPKNLTVGRAFETEFREISGDDMCWFSGKIQECAAAKLVMTQDDFEVCVSTLFDKYEANGWVGSIDKGLLNKVVDLSNVFTPTFISKKTTDMERDAARDAAAKAQKKEKKVNRQQNRNKAKKTEAKKTDKEQAKADAAAQKKADRIAAKKEARAGN